MYIITNFSVDELIGQKEGLGFGSFSIIFYFALSEQLITRTIYAWQENNLESLNGAKFK